MPELTSLFKPKSVALIGASTDPKKYGYWTAKSLIDNGFTGRLHMVSRTKADHILGIPTVASVLDIEDEIDLAVVAIAPRFILPVIRECAQKGVKQAVIVSTGFGETGQQGRQLEAEIREIARNAGMGIVGPNCMGIYSAGANLNASIIDLAPGPLSLVLQSGNFGIDINFNARMRELGYSCWATIGNQADLRFADFVDYIGRDEATRVLMLYMEGLRVESEADGRRFLEAAKKTSLDLPVIAIKIGRSRAGARAAASHTGSLSGKETVFDAAFQQAGIVRVDTPAQLLDVAEAFTKCKPARGNRIAVLTDGGGHGVMATDTAERHGLEVPVLSDATQAKLREILAPHCPVGNPVDLAGTPEADMWVFDRCAEVLLDDPDIDALVIVGLYGGYADLSEEFRALEIRVAQKIADRVRASAKPVVMHSIYWPARPESLEILSRGGIPVYGGIDTAVRAMGCLAAHERARQRLAAAADASLPGLPDGRHRTAGTIISNARGEGRHSLLETEARDLLAAYGFDLPPHILARGPEAAAQAVEAFGVPVAMKIVSPDILHKTDANGVLLNIMEPGQARDAFSRLLESARACRPDADIRGVLVTPMLAPGVECILGTTWDPTFGPAVMFGLGGVFVEVLKDVSFRVAPMNPVEATDMLEEIRGAAMLDGVRGGAAVDKQALAAAICRLSLMATELEDIAEIDMNPVFALEKGIAVADARIVLHARQGGA